MIKFLPLRKRVEQLRERLAYDCRCQQALEGSWESDEACMFALLQLVIECRAAGDSTTSLELLTWLRQQGVEHPLVVDNQIRGLIDAHRFGRPACYCRYWPRWIKARCCRGRRTPC